MHKFVLIDGNAIMHRAYHALPGFTTSKGEPVGAIFGFVSMLLRILTDLKPEYLAVAFDMAAPTFRQQLYVGYQAQRPKMEGDLSPQFEGIQKILDSFGVPVFGVEGYEADDVIGTIARRAIDWKLDVGSKKLDKEVRNGKFEVIIVSGDRDLLQLVNSHVKVYMPIKGLSEAKMYGEKEVEEKYGLEPKQIVDMKALTGDASDNYPGVRGIGPKTATTLLTKYKTLEAIYEHMGDLAEKQQKALAQEAEQATLAKKLATIVCDVPIQFEVSDCRFQISDKKKAIETLESFEFRTLTNRLREYLGKEAKETKETEGPKEREGSRLKIKSKDNGGQMELI